MGDTSPDMEKLYNKMLMEKSGEERMKMGMSMYSTAIRVIWSSMPDSLPVVEKRKRLFLTLYGNDYSEEQKGKIISLIEKGEIGYGYK